MRSLVRLTVLSALAAGLAGPALADAAQGRFIHPADADKNQKVSRAEWLSSGESAATFRAADTNRDGFVVGPEFAAWFMKKEGIAPFRASARDAAATVDRLVKR